MNSPVSRLVSPDVIAAAPSALAVSIYRAPARGEGSIDLDFLHGFALITETRQVSLPAGVSRLRFEGVADGIEAVSAIVSGLPNGILEKNRDAAVLSPASLIAASLGKAVTLERSNRRTGISERMPGTLLSDADGGLVFQTPQGVEALRCSGLPETFVFDGDAGLSATPTLSVLVKVAQPTTRTVTLSYLTRGFDWAADYTATLSADGKTVALGAWVTLANSNGVGFPHAHTQVIAGRVNHEDGYVEPFELGGAIIANCWPRGSTSDPMEATRMLKKAELLRFAGADALKMPAAALAEMSGTAARRVEQEQLGDLKLYRVPDRTSVASRQSKQVRLLDRSGVPVTTVYAADIGPAQEAYSLPAERLLRTINITANHLGLPLPSGSVSVLAKRDGWPFLVHETKLRDLAVNEDVELSLGNSPDVQVSVDPEKTSADHVTRIEVSNAKTQTIDFELHVRLPVGMRIVHADVAQGSKNGRPLFKLKVPGNSVSTFRFVSRSS